MQGASSSSPSQSRFACVFARIFLGGRFETESRERMKKEKEKMKERERETFHPSILGHRKYTKKIII